MKPSMIEVLIGQVSILKLDHVVTGDEKTIKVSLNYIDTKLVAKMKPSMIEYEVLIGQVSHLRYIHEFMFENNEISFLMAGKSKHHLHEKSYLYKTLYYLSPSYACFKDMTTNYQVQVVDKTTVKVDVRFSVLKDTLEMLKLVAMMKPTMIEFEVLIGQVSQLKLDYVVTGDEKTITIILNYIDMKLVAKMKPSMIEYEVLIGQVSHLKYVHEFMFENNEISFLMAGKSKLQLNEKSYLYKTLYYLSPSYACFKDMTTNYQVEVVDKAIGKVDVQFSVLKDTLEMLKLVAMMKPTMIEFEVLIGQVSHLKLDYVATGDEMTITTSLNYIDMKLVAKMKPSMIEYEVL